MTKKYVTFFDTFLSGWGEAEGKTAVFIIECENREEAQIVKRNGEARSDMKLFMISGSRPYFAPNKYQVSFRQRTPEMERWFTEGAFEEGEEQ